MSSGLFTFLLIVAAGLMFWLLKSLKKDLQGLILTNEL